MVEIIGEIDKNTLEVIRASLTEYKDKDRIDIRVYYQAGADADDYKPTKKGINLGLDQWGDFKELVEKIDQAISKKE